MAKSFFSMLAWHKLPTLFGIRGLFRIRHRLRTRNLHDSNKLPSIGSASLGPPGGDAQIKTRTVDGAFNDLKQPAMGAAGTRFGRNVPLDRAVPDEGSILTPSPRTVSLELMTRDSFKPVESLNLLAASWIQFMVHDWFSHGHNRKENPIEIPIRDGDPWPERPMLVRRTRSDPTRPANDSNRTPTFLNTETHWWDGSQIYGSDQATQQQVRSGVDGKLALAADGLLPIDPKTGIDVSGVTGNWWVGLSMLHTLFTHEHNAICDRLREEFPRWSDDELFGHARLINAAQMAKIHTIEWTPSIVAHPTVKLALNGNWRTIPRSRTDHHGVPFSMTEEFVAVYRMHPLMPDEFVFRSLDTNEVIEERSLPQVANRQAREAVNKISMKNLFYSFGVSHPGAITLHNYPAFLQRLERPDGPTMDLCAVDILRDRERGVPRYNEFRRLLDMSAPKTFEELTPNREWAEQMRRVYANDIEKVDLMVGMYAEPLPAGFGFSETAFRIFILMATRRLKSDRFYTVDYRSEIYTRTGLKWIEKSSLAAILLRHYPELGRLLEKSDNAFSPWKR